MSLSKKIFLISFIVIIISLSLKVAIIDPEVCLKAKLIDISARLMYLITGLGTKNFSRSRLNALIKFISLINPEQIPSYAEIKKIKLPSLIDDYKIEAKIFKKKGTEENLQPILFYIHGGGFVLEEFGNNNMKYFLDNNMIFFSFRYRLSPENKFPIPLEDCYSSLFYIVNQTESYLKNWNSKIVILGDSAGGNMAASLYLLVRDRGLKVNVVCQILIYPVFFVQEKIQSHIDYNNWYILPENLILWFNRQYVNNENDFTSLKYVSALYEENLNGLPDNLIVLAERDYLYDEGLMYYERLKKINNKTEIIIYKAEHGFFYFEVDYSEEAVLDVIKYINTKL